MRKEIGIILAVAMLCIGATAYAGTGASRHSLTLGAAPYSLKTVYHYNAQATDLSVYGFGVSLDYRWNLTSLLYVGTGTGYRGFLEKEMLPDRWCSQMPLLATFGFHHEGKRISWHAGIGAGVEFGFFGPYSGTYFECQMHGGVSYALTERLSLTGKCYVSLILQPNKSEPLLSSRSLVVTPLSVGVSYAL